jgi:5-methylcytosine-specific restriction enzyme A
MYPFNFNLEIEHIKKEKDKARILRATQWWKRKIAKGICYYCKKSVRPKELTMDHIVPLSRGGLSTKGNVVPSCKECNNKKKQLLPMEWDQYIINISDNT